MIYLYGLVDSKVALSEADLSDIKGVTGPVALHTTPVGLLCYGLAETSDILPKRRHLLAHTRVLEALNDRGPVLPMRFGMFTDNLPHLSEMLLKQSDQISQEFAKVQDHVELGLRVSFPREPALDATLNAATALKTEHKRLSSHAKPPHFKVAEFGRRLSDALDNRRGAAQKKLLERLKPFCASYLLKAPESDVQVIALDALVQRGEQDAFGQAAEAAADECRAFAGGAEPEVRLVGPVPPFNFVALTLDGAIEQAA